MYEDEEDMVGLASMVLTKITGEGDQTIKIDDLFQSAGYIPSRIVVDCKEENQEYDTSECELIEDSLDFEILKYEVDEVDLFLDFTGYEYLVDELDTFTKEAKEELIKKLINQFGKRR